MSAVKSRRKPTDAELAILRVLWARGPSTVRHVLDALNEERVTGYTTVLKLLQIMTDKQLVTRDETDRTHIYRASFSETETQRQLVDDLMDRAFGGSAMQLVMRALSGRQTSETDLAEIRRLLDEHDGDKR